MLNLDINIRDPLFFDRDLDATYEYSDGLESSNIIFDVDSIGETESVLKTTFKGNDYETSFNHEGFYVDPVSGVSEYHCLFWVHIVTESGRSEFSNLVGNTYEVIDPVGILGPANEIYSIKFTGRTAYWPEEPGVHGAQASYNFDIFKGDERIGSGLIDKTCGMVFTMNANGVSLKLLDTSYDISRNRLYALVPIILIMIAIPILTYLVFFLRKKHSNWDEPFEETLDTVFLAGYAGVIAVIDIYNDVWMYSLFGLGGNMLMRGAVLAIGAVYSLYRGYKLKWIIPGIYEIAFVTAISLQLLGDSYAGHLTAAMGMTASLLCFIWQTGKEPKQKEDGLVDGVLSNIV